MFILWFTYIHPYQANPQLWCFVFGDPGRAKRVGDLGMFYAGCSCYLRSPLCTARHTSRKGKRDQHTADRYIGRASTTFIRCVPTCKVPMVILEYASSRRIVCELFRGSRIGHGTKQEINGPESLSLVAVTTYRLSYLALITRCCSV